MSKTKINLVLLPLPARGHMITMIELAKHLLHLSTTNPNVPPITITILLMQPYVPNPHLISYVASTASTHPDIAFIHLAPPETPPPATLRFQALLSLVSELRMPLIKSTLLSLHSSSPVSAIVIDFFTTNVIDVAKELGIPTYIFFTSSLAALGFLLHLPTLDSHHLRPEKKAAEMRGESVNFPGFSNQLPLTVFPDAVAYIRDDAYEWYLHHGRRMREVSGIIVNGTVELQPRCFQALEEGLYIDRTPPVYPVGPLLYFNKQEDGSQCLRWLDEQPRGSVVFLCFGSSGSMSREQAREVAIGLEWSGHRFLWVLSITPPEALSFHAAMGSQLDDVLPEGFVERTRERGLVWAAYAPQWEILGHEAVGGFVTHCGWNSCLESLWFGVPMAAWPLYAEQHLNGFELVEEMGVAVEVRIDRLRRNWAAADEVERVVRLLMGEGSEKVRERVREMREKVRRAVEEGGSSHCNLEKVVEEWKSRGGLVSEVKTNDK